MNNSVFEEWIDAECTAPRTDGLYPARLTVGRMLLLKIGAHYVILENWLRVIRSTCTVDRHMPLTSRESTNIPQSLFKAFIMNVGHRYWRARS